MPQDRQAWVAIDLWPGRLPKCARKCLGPTVRRQWQALRVARDTKARSLREYRKSTRNLLDTSQELTLRMFGYQDRILSRWYPVAQDLLDRIRAIRTEKIVSVALVEHEDEGYSLHFLSDRVTPQEGLYAMALRLICVALDKGGVVLIHHLLPFMTLSNGTNGHWTPQERLYVVRCKDGQWRPMPVAELRQAHQKTGEVEGLTFGVLPSPMNSGERAL